MRTHKERSHATQDRHPAWNSPASRWFRHYVFVLYFIILVVAAIVLWQARTRLDTPKISGGWVILSVTSFVAAVSGLLFSYLGTWRAHSADVGTRYLLDKLEETQRIVTDSPLFYAEVFDVHIIRPLSRAITSRDGDEYDLRRLSLLLATPAYGYQVLGLPAHLEF